MSVETREIFLQHNWGLLGKKSNMARWIVWFASVWSIWLYRNNTVFKQEVPIPKFECVSVNYICR